MLVKRVEGGYLIGGVVYPSVFAAEHRFRQARSQTRHPLRKLLCSAVLLELGAIS